jgi:YfiH family protein
MKPATKTIRKKVAARRRTAATWKAVRAGGVQIIQASPLASARWLVHGFSTRLGGESKLDGARALNLGYTEWDTRNAVNANRKRLLAALGAEGMALVTLRQIHSDIIHEIRKAPAQSPRDLSRSGHGPLRGDALITRAPGLLVAVQTADCVPILLADPRRRVVAAVHAGWRGTLKRIVAKTLGRMRMFHGTKPADVLAALGPGIGACCYEVGPEVVQAFAGQFAAAREWFAGEAIDPTGRTLHFDDLASGEDRNPFKWLWMTAPGHDPPPPRLHLDLIAANRWQLLDAGVKPRNIAATELCTACRTDLLFSHRREQGKTGRLMGLIGICG